MSYSALPPGKVDILALGRIFEDTTNSYKLVFFQALLNLLKQRLPASGSVLLKTQDLAIEMAALAWYPHAFFKLSFGSQDKLGRVLDKLCFDLDERAIAHADTQKRLRLAIQEQYKQIGLKDRLRYVPYRLLTPFFSDRLRNLKNYKDHEVSKFVHEWSAETYASKNPALYKIIKSEEAIEIHPIWVAYLSKSLPIVVGWVGKHWIDYLQSRNPNTPNIPNKISPPLNRAPLKLQTDYWRAIIKDKQLRCLYSGDVLDPHKFALDHFIPWSFVCHDQIWNLIPVSPKANSAKSNCVPSEDYLNGFVDLQSVGLNIARQILDDTRWRKHTEPFVSDLHVPSAKLLNAERLRAAYLGVLPAIMSLAKQIGFPAGWKH